MRAAIDLGRKTLLLAAGLGLVAAGGAMLVLPGPGLAFVAAGLATLAAEFAWARRALEVLRRAAGRVAGALPRWGRGGAGASRPDA